MLEICFDVYQTKITRSTFVANKVYLLLSATRKTVTIRNMGNLKKNGLKMDY